MTKIIAIIQTGVPVKMALDRYGQFDEWFINAIDLDATQTQTYHVYEKLVFPDIKDIAGIIITGSPSMVTEKLDWSEITIEWLKQFIDSDIPMLGVCYGHQLLAKMLGGTVDWNPLGRQMGQVELAINQQTAKDPLFGPILNKLSSKQSSNHVSFLATHQQSVIKLPDEVVILGSTQLDANHSFRYKNHIWGLQFHPEFTAAIIKDYIKVRSADLIQEGLDPKQMIRAVDDSDNGTLLLKQFKNICLQMQ